MLNIKTTLIENLKKCKILDQYNEQNIINAIEKAIEEDDQTLKYLNDFFSNDENCHMMAAYVELIGINYIHNLNDIEDEIDTLNDSYTWLSGICSEEKLGEYLVEDLGYLNVPEELLPYIDYKEIVKDLRYGGLYYEISNYGCLYSWG